MDWILNSVSILRIWLCSDFCGDNYLRNIGSGLTNALLVQIRYGSYVGFDLVIGFSKFLISNSYTEHFNFELCISLKTFMVRWSLAIASDLFS